MECSLHIYILCSLAALFSISISVSPCIAFTLSLFLSFSCFLIDMPEGLQFSFSCSLFSVSLYPFSFSFSLYDADGLHGLGVVGELLANDYDTPANGPPFTFKIDPKVNLLFYSIMIII